ncbi:hypothetical protein GCM10028801_41840 [Nocardioides maradonensis]
MAELADRVPQHPHRVRKVVVPARDAGAVRTPPPTQDVAVALGTPGATQHPELTEQTEDEDDAGRDEERRDQAGRDDVERHEGPPDKVVSAIDCRPRLLRRA